MAGVYEWAQKGDCWAMVEACAQLHTVRELVQAVLVHHKIQLYLRNKLYVVGCDLRLMSIVFIKDSSVWNGAFSFLQWIRCRLAALQTDSLRDVDSASNESVVNRVCFECQDLSDSPSESRLCLRRGSNGGSVDSPSVNTNIILDPGCFLTWPHEAHSRTHAGKHSGTAKNA